MNECVKNHWAERRGRRRRRRRKNTRQSVNLINKINFYDRFYYIVPFNQIDEQFSLHSLFFAVPFLYCFPNAEQHQPSFVLFLFPFILPFIAAPVFFIAQNHWPIYFVKSHCEYESMYHCHFEPWTVSNQINKQAKKYKYEIEEMNNAHNEMTNQP